MIPAHSPDSSASKILVALDESAVAPHVFSHALEWASLRGQALLMVSVIHSPAIIMAEPDEQRLLIDQAHKRLGAMLDALKEQAAAQQVLASAIIEQGDPIEAILIQTRRANIDHIIVGHRSKGPMERLLLGSVAKGVVDGAPCTVSVVR